MAIGVIAAQRAAVLTRDATFEDAPGNAAADLRRAAAALEALTSDSPS